MGPTVLFTHLEIILLQYFSVFVFSFNFQFSAVSKQTLSFEMVVSVADKYCLKSKGNQFQNGGRCQLILQDMAEEAKKSEKREKTKERGDI